MSHVPQNKEYILQLLAVAEVCRASFLVACRGNRRSCCRGFPLFAAAFAVEVLRLLASG